MEVPDYFMKVFVKLLALQKKSKMKTSVISLGVLMILSGCLENIKRQSEPFIPTDDKTRIAEAFAIAGKYCDKVWPGWAEVPLSLLFITKNHEFLIRHPLPSDDFEPLGFDQELDAEVLFRKRIFPENLLAAFQAVNDKSSIVMGTPEATGRKSPAWTITLLHEHFHQLQYFQPEYFAKANKLDLARGDSTAMWMLNFDFPYSDPLVSERFKSLSQQLHNLVQNRENLNAETISDYLDTKWAFRELVGEENYSYMQFQTWQEGVALYTEWKLLDLISAGYEPSPEFQALDDFMPFTGLQEQIYHRINRQLEAMNMSEWKRVSFYAFGAGEALVLDHLKPDWREHYFENMFNMDALWKL